MQTYLYWMLLALAASLLLGGAYWYWRKSQGTDDAQRLPNEWNLTARPVFSVDERRIYRQLREALPHHVVLAKLPLVRFCQPTDPDQVRYWYEILGANHVSFAICSANGRVLAAIDLEQERHVSRRSVKIKQAMLSACKIRYMRCAPHELPSTAELQLMVPLTGPSARSPQPAPSMAGGRDGMGARRRERPTLWQDSNFLQDSFFGDDQDGRADRPGADTAPGRLRAGLSVREIPNAPLESGGVVSDTAGSWMRH